MKLIQLFRSTDNQRDEVVLEDDEYGILNWDWIGETSPIVAPQTEPEWVLGRFCESLVRYLAIQRQNRHVDKREEGEEFTLEKETNSSLAKEA